MGDVLSSCQKDSAAVDDDGLLIHHPTRSKMDGASNGTARTTNSDESITHNNNNNTNTNNTNKNPRKRSVNEDDGDPTAEPVPSDESSRKGGGGGFFRRLSWRSNNKNSSNSFYNGDMSSGILRASTYDQVHQRAARQLQQRFHQHHYNNKKYKLRNNNRQRQQLETRHDINSQDIEEMNQLGNHHHNSNIPIMGVVGLANLGNTCFLNSSLQCLSATIPLTDYFLGYDYQREINRNNPLGSGGRLAKAYGALLGHVWSGKSMMMPAPQNNTHYNNNNIVLRQPVAQFKQQLASTVAPQFHGNAQHDAQELLALLLDAIHEDLNRVQQKPYIEEQDCDGHNDEVDAMVAWKNYLQRNKSIVVDIFQGQLKSRCQCTHCGHVNVRFEPFMYLSLPMNRNCRSLEDCMELFLQEERLEGDNQWYCSHCKTHRDAKKKMDIWILPPILIVHLKRFRFDDPYGRVGAKNTAAVQYPLHDWDLRPYVKSASAKTNPSQYDLYAVANHHGGGGGSGHYTAYAKSRRDEWYEFNDSQTARVRDAASTLRRNAANAYVLFYNRTSATEEDGQVRNDNIKENKTQQQQQQPPLITPPRSIPLVRPQSTNRPDLWPHTQVADMGQVRSFARSSNVVRVSVSGIDEEEDDDEDDIDTKGGPAKQPKQSKNQQSSTPVKRSKRKQQQQPLSDEEQRLSPRPNEAYEMELNSPTTATAKAIAGELTDKDDFVLL